MSSPNIEKAVLTQSGFDVMGLHDSRVYAFALEPNSHESGKLLIDLDYVVPWVTPSQPGKPFSFWVAPGTLAFEEAWAFAADISPESEFTLELDRIERSDPEGLGRSCWTLDGHQFTARVLAPGFTQSLRGAPIASPYLSLSMADRGA